MSPSNRPHVIACLEENLELLKNPFGVIEEERVPLWNLSKALIGMYQDIAAEFENLDSRLKRIEQQLQR